MDITCKKEDLVKAVSKTSSVTEKKTTMPILGNILLDVRDGVLHIFGTDLEITMQATLSVSVNKKGKICTPAHQFFEIIRQLPEENVSLSQDDQNWLNVNSGKSHFRVATVDAAEFPEMPRKEDYQFKKISSEVLLDGINHTHYSMSSDEMRPNLNGILMEYISDTREIQMVATDGHRLAMYKNKLQGDDSFTLEKRVILPRKGINEVKKILSEQGSTDISVSFSPANAVFDADGVVIFMKLVVGEYPEYNKVIPQGDRRKMRIGRDDFGHALKRVSLLSEGKSKCVRMNVNNDHVLLKANSPEMGEAEEEVGAEFTGENLNIGFNARYLLDALGVVKDSHVVFELDHEQSPGIIKSAENENYLAVIMPMRI